MDICRNEFEDLAEATKAQKEFPFCRDCKSGNKIQTIMGRVFLLCISRPLIHHGVSNWH